MPTYQYQCSFGTCGTFEREYHLGEAPKSTRCGEGHFARRVFSVNIQPSALENKGERVRQQNENDRLVGLDRDAYKRMRRKGLQPERVAGSHTLEDRVEDNIDIEYGALYSQEQKKPDILGALEEAAQIRAELGMSDDMVEGDAVRDELGVR